MLGISLSVDWPSCGKPHHEIVIYNIYIYIWCYMMVFPTCFFWAFSNHHFLVMLSWLVFAKSLHLPVPKAQVLVVAASLLAASRPSVGFLPGARLSRGEDRFSCHSVPWEVLKRMESSVFWKYRSTLFFYDFMLCSFVCQCYFFVSWRVSLTCLMASGAFQKCFCWQEGGLASQELWGLDRNANTPKKGWSAYNNEKPSHCIHKQFACMKRGNHRISSEIFDIKTCQSLTQANRERFRLLPMQAYADMKVRRYSVLQVQGGWAEFNNLL